MLLFIALIILEELSLAPIAWGALLFKDKLKTSGS